MKKKPKYKFYLNTYADYKWTRCLECDKQTKVRKFCLVLHFENKEKEAHQLLSLNISCKYCPKCDLIIGQKLEIDEAVINSIPQTSQNFDLKDYSVMGTMDKKDWLKNQKGELSISEAFDSIYLFKKVLQFEIQPAGWYFDGK